MHHTYYNVMEVGTKIKIAHFFQYINVDFGSLKNILVLKQPI
jgi:hypothetical protein